MLHPTAPIRLAIAAAATATILSAQTYVARAETDDPNASRPGPSEHRSGSVATTRISYRDGALNRYGFDAEARASRAGVNLYAYMYRSAAVSNSSYAIGGWSLDDVVFSGPVPNQPISVQLSFDVTAGVAGGSCPSGSRFLYQDLEVYDQAGNSVAYWNTFVPGGQPAPVTPGTALVTPSPLVPRSGFQITTDTTYRFEIRLVVRADGNQCWSTQSARAQFSAQPFVLPAGVTANSAKGDIVNNAWMPGTPPLIEPRLTNTEPVVAGNPLTMFVSRATPSTLGIVFTGDSLSPVGVALAPWISVDLVNPQTFEVFFTDSMGDWSQTYTVPAGIGGTATALQAAVFTGARLDEVYSTNSTVLLIQ